MIVYSELSDDKLVQAACRGDVDCFAELYRRHIAKVVAVAFCELSDRGLAEDAAQESFAEACRSLQNLRDASKFSYWLATICRRVAGQINKRHRRHSELIEQDVEAPANDNDSYDEEIRDAVDKLPHLAKEVIILHYFGELSHAEIAATLDITAAAVHGRLARAREQLKEYLMRKGLGGEHSMTVPIDNNFLDRSLRTAYSGRPKLSFDDWRADYGDALSQLGRRPRSFFSERITLMRWSAAILTVCVATAALWMSLGGPSADQVFAQAIDQAANAKTFSADEATTFSVDGRKEINQQRIMFKQPYLERLEMLKNGEVQEITITDYGRRRRLMLTPANKEARYSDWKNVFEIDPKTGNVVPEKLNMSFRDELLSLQAKAVEDLGEVELSGRKARLTQSSNGERVVKVWTDAHSGRPVQVSITRPNQEDIVSSIKIDEPLSDDLFNLESQPGYKVVSNPMPSERVGQLFAKVKFLLLECWQYEAKHPKTFPAQLSDLDLKPEVLQNLLMTPGGGRVVYIPPEFEGDISKKVVLYEAYENWPAEGIVVGFGDAHAERIAKEEVFKQRLEGR